MAKYFSARPYTLVRIFVPQLEVKPGELGIGDKVSDIIEVIKRHSFMGRIGNYRGVFETSTGVEGYMPEAGANPTHGQIDELSVVRTVTVSTYASTAITEEQLQRFLDDVIEVHPWELPMIEIWRDGKLFLWEPINE